MIEQISKIFSFRIPLIKRKRIDMKIEHFHRDFSAIYRRNNLSNLALSYKLWTLFFYKGKFLLYYINKGSETYLKLLILSLR